MTKEPKGNGIDFSKTVTADHRRCLALLSQVRAKAVEWPARWAAAKQAGNRRRMNALLLEAEGLAAMEKVLRGAEIRMRQALLSRDHTVNNIRLKQNAEKEAKAGFSFEKRLPLFSERVALEGERKQIDRQTVQLGVDFFRLRLADLAAGGAR